ncbi:hypothetical protein [Streptomyces roseolus]|uniref:hypothetical protein n=1 Tax=Streptomyces roseolus TaxID=67358 RepID=UPI00167BA65D|nr:hypothetical protein [Streptomyces roseolus]GGR29296.1 hypothetical protein GCM10010282_22240 [Streptomyces roseolus]
MDGSDPQDVGAAFWAQVQGFTIVEGPAPPDTPLGRLQAFAAVHRSDRLTEDHVRAAIEGLPLLPGSVDENADGGGGGSTGGGGGGSAPSPGAG